jgi:hypothetical protein
LTCNRARSQAVTALQPQVSRVLSVKERAIALAAAISVDYDFFSQHSSGFGGLPIPFMLPFPGFGGGGGGEAVPPPVDAIPPVGSADQTPPANEGDGGGSGGVWSDDDDDDDDDAGGDDDWGGFFGGDE